jgi:hypothetical protein
MADEIAVPPAEAPTREAQMLTALENFEKAETKVDAAQQSQAPKAQAQAPVAVVSPPKAEATPAPVPAPVPEAPKAEEEPMLARMAKREAALRQERQQVEPYIQALKVLPPDRVQALTKALSSRDPVSALAAMGFTHAEYANRMLGDTSPPKPKTPEQASKTELPPEIRGEIEELKAFKAQYQAEQARIQQTQLVDQIGKLVKSNPKFNYLTKLEAFGDVLGIINRYHAETQRLPGDTFEESVLMAAELAEKQLQQQAERWGKVLTPPAQPASVVTEVAKAPESPPSAGSEVPRTLTNSMASQPAPVQPAPKTRDEAIAALLSDPVFLAM